MAVDVLLKPKAGQPFRNGSAVVEANKFGTKQVNTTNLQANQPDETTIFNQLTTRFDDPTYYST